MWLDDYAKYYYQRVGNDKGDYGDITSRKQLRDNLGCKSFEWYLKNIYPELFIPGESVAHGEVCTTVISCFILLQMQLNYKLNFHSRIKYSKFDLEYVRNTAKNECYIPCYAAY